MATAIFRDDVRAAEWVSYHSWSRPNRYDDEDMGELYCGTNGMLAFDPIVVQWEYGVGYLNYDEDLNDEQLEFLQESGLRLLTY